MNAVAISLDAVIFWLFVVAWLVVGGSLLVGVLPRIVREALRLVKRVLALVDDSPLPLALAKAEGDAARIERALDQIPVLQRRAAAAVAVIRSTPLVPPALVAIVARIRAEAVAFRRAAR